MYKVYVFHLQISQKRKKSCEVAALGVQFSETTDIATFFFNEIDRLVPLPPKDIDGCGANHLSKIFRDMLASTASELNLFS